MKDFLIFCLEFAIDFVVGCWLSEPKSFKSLWLLFDVCFVSLNMWIVWMELSFRLFFSLGLGVDFVFVVRCGLHKLGGVGVLCFMFLLHLILGDGIVRPRGLSVGGSLVSWVLTPGISELSISSHIFRLQLLHLPFLMLVWVSITIFTPILHMKQVIMGSKEINVLLSRSIEII